MAARDDAAALGKRIGDMLFDLGKGRLVDQRAEIDAFIEAVTSLQRAGRLREFFGKGIINAVLHVETVGADASLAIVAEFGDHRAFDGGIQIGIVEHDKGRIAAKLQAQFLDGRRALPVELGADFGRAGEGELTHDGTRSHLAADGAGRACENTE